MQNRGRDVFNSACKKMLGLMLLTIIYFSFPPQAQAIQHPPNNELPEVFLRFSYTGTGPAMVTGRDQEGEILLPVTSLFSALMIPFEYSASGKTLNGNIPAHAISFRFDGEKQQANSSLTTLSLNSDKVHFTESEMYAAPAVLRELLQLDFQLNPRTLTLRLSTNHTLPVAERQVRLQRQSRIQLNQTELNGLDVMYAPDRRLLDGGVLDYRISSSLNTERQNNHTYFVRGGAELLGGDMQGSIRGAVSGELHTFQTNDIRWRYGMPENPWLRSVSLGQSRFSRGFQGRGFTGIQLSNQPLAPRFLFDDWTTSVQVPPGSELEVFLNRRLFDYQLIDESGRYDLALPLRYGQSTIEMNTYYPDGTSDVMERRIQIPFTLSKPGELLYTLSAGYMDQYLPQSGERPASAEGIVAYGLNSLITAESGFRYLGSDVYEPLLVYGALSARTDDGHVFRVDAAPGYFYEFTGSAFYANNVRWSLNMTNYTGSSLYNRFGYDYRLQSMLYIPWLPVNTPGGIHIRMNHDSRPSETLTRYSAGATMRLSRLNVQVEYRDALRGRAGELLSTNASIRGNMSYRFGRSAALMPLRNALVRISADYRRSVSSVHQLQLSLSRPVTRTGRIRLQLQHFPERNSTFAHVGIVLNLNSMRASSGVTGSRGNINYQQSVMGSVQLDRARSEPFFDNRYHTGKATVSVRMFVDVTGNGIYEPDGGDYLIRDNAVRLAGRRHTLKQHNGITRITGLQSYRKYDLVVHTAAIRDPALVPLEERVRFSAAPNRSTPVDIPFYQTGVAEGNVSLMRAGRSEPAGGIRIMLERTESDFTKTVTTFTNGIFYAAELPLGEYRAQIDPNQLQQLQAESSPGELTFTIKVTTGGHVVEGLNFRILSKEDE